MLDLKANSVCRSIKGFLALHQVAHTNLVDPNAANTDAKTDKAQASQLAWALFFDSPPQPFASSANSRRRRSLAVIPRR